MARRASSSDGAWNMLATKVEPRSLISWEVAIGWGGGRDDLINESKLAEAILKQMSVS